MNTILNHIKETIYNRLELYISKLQIESESKEYHACRFKLNDLHIISRNAKITPKKSGQFVTFWKRNRNGPIEPFHENDRIDFYIVNLQTEDQVGQFVFPKSILIEKRIISTDRFEGKRAFRVYPSWDTVKNKEAERRQKWQLEYFYEINDSMDLDRVKELFKKSL